MARRKGATTGTAEGVAAYGGEESPALEVGVTHQRTVGIRDLRDHLSEYLAVVKGGVSVTVTEHGRAIASLVPLGITPELQALADTGFITLPTRPMGDPAEWPRIRVDRESSDLIDWAKGGSVR